MKNSDLFYDVIIVGGGSAGCIIASHLLENDQNLKILLVEAGDDSNADSVDSPLYDASRLVLDKYNWDYQINLDGPYRYHDYLLTGEIAPSAHKVFDYRLGKILGGSSAVNGAIALRALSSDFSSWQKHDCNLWTWEHVLPWYIALENDEDFANQTEIHGKNGSLRLKRPNDSILDPVDRAVLKSITNERSLSYIEDLNGSSNHAGIGKVPSNVRDTYERLDAYTAFLKPFRSNKNLKVLVNTQVDKLLFEKNKCVGISAQQDNIISTYKAEKIVLCAGAIGTPVLLQKSGIADQRLLKQNNIPVVADEPEVGCNFMDHLSTVIWATPSEDAFLNKSPWRQVVARINSDDLSIKENIDVQLGLLNNVETKFIPNLINRNQPPTLIGASIMLMRPETKGRVYITKENEKFKTVIDYPVIESSSDHSKMIKSIRHMWRIINHENVKPYFSHIHFWNDRLIENDFVMEQAIKNMLSPAWHACGTVRMGSGKNPVHQNCKLKCIEGVYIADASVFPEIPSMPTNLTTLMLAKRVSNSILSGEFK